MHDDEYAHFNPPVQPTGGSRWEAASLTRSRRNHSPSAEPIPTDIARSRFPYAIVWTTLPGITMFFPVIGHTGICDSRGVIMDFAGPYTISVDRLSFAKPFLYLPLDPSLVARKLEGQTPAAAWDAGVDAGCEEYCGRMHNICCDNCHSHVARCLNEMRYMGRSNWGMVEVGALVILKGKWVSPYHALCVWLPWLIVVAIILFFSFVKV